MGLSGQPHSVCLTLGSGCAHEFFAWGYPPDLVVLAGPTPIPPALLCSWPIKLCLRPGNRWVRPESLGGHVTLAPGLSRGVGLLCVLSRSESTHTKPYRSHQILVEVLGS